MDYWTFNEMNYINLFLQENQNRTVQDLIILGVKKMYPFKTKMIEFVFVIFGNRF